MRGFRRIRWCVLRTWCGVIAVCGLVWVGAARSAVAQAVDATTSGDEVCASCHAQAKTYPHTAHRATSSLATNAALASLVQAAGPRLNVTSAPLPTLAFLLELKDGRYMQTAISGWGEDVARTSKPIDVVVGSGKRGQTFLSWSGDRLFELPVSFWRDGSRWINSPGYVDGTADFGRPVQPGCLECHVTKIVPLSADATANAYARGSLVAGIGCATCHGPGEAHVAAETAAAARGGKAESTGILNPARFSRDRQVDLCALCHSGLQRKELTAAFRYVPGEPLSRYFESVSTAVEDRPDVHGNQVGLLQRSRCFAQSDTMTCSTCHDVHTVGQPVAAYAPRCLSCHTWQSCGESHRLGASIQTRCIDCHMPVQETNAIVSVTAGARVQARMRTHWIKVYAAQDAKAQ